MCSCAYSEKKNEIKNLLEFFVVQDTPKTFREKLIYPLCYEIKCDLKHVYEIFYTNEADGHVTVHRVRFLIIKPIKCTNFSNLFLE